MRYRTREHYVRMLENNKWASVGHTLAAHMVIAAKNGLVDFDKDDGEVRAVARRLREEYGEVLSPAEVRKEMEQCKTSSSS